jgi:hypothetical protein
MHDPVSARDGFTYERKAIEKWLKKSQKSPKTGVEMESKQMLPNHTLKSIIMDWIESEAGMYIYIYICIKAYVYTFLQLFCYDD